MQDSLLIILAYIARVFTIMRCQPGRIKYAPSNILVTRKVGNQKGFLIRGGTRPEKLAPAPKKE